MARTNAWQSAAPSAWRASGQRYLVRDAGTEGEVELKGKEVELILTGAPVELI